MVVAQPAPLWLAVLLSLTIGLRNSKRVNRLAGTGLPSGAIRRPIWIEDRRIELLDVEPLNWNVLLAPHSIIKGLAGARGLGDEVKLADHSMPQVAMEKSSSGGDEQRSPLLCVAVQKREQVRQLDYEEDAVTAYYEQVTLVRSNFTVLAVRSLLQDPPASLTSTSIGTCSKEQIARADALRGEDNELRYDASFADQLKRLLLAAEAEGNTEQAANSPEEAASPGASPIAEDNEGVGEAIVVEETEELAADNSDGGSGANRAWLSHGENVVVRVTDGPHADCEGIAQTNLNVAVRDGGGTVLVLLAVAGTDFVRIQCSHLQRVAPARKEQVKVVAGGSAGETGTLIGIDGENGIVKLDSNMDIMVFHMEALGKLGAAPGGDRVSGVDASGDMF